MKMVGEFSLSYARRLNPPARSTHVPDANRLPPPGPRRRPSHRTSPYGNTVIRRSFSLKGTIRSSRGDNAHIYLPYACDMMFPCNRLHRNCSFIPGDSWFRKISTIRAEVFSRKAQIAWELPGPINALLPWSLRARTLPGQKIEQKVKDARNVAGNRSSQEIGLRVRCLIRASFSGTVRWPNNCVSQGWFRAFETPCVVRSLMQ